LDQIISIKIQPLCDVKKCLFFSQQDIENFKAEVEKRQLKESSPDGSGKVSSVVVKELDEGSLPASPMSMSPIESS